MQHDKSGGEFYDEEANIAMFARRGDPVSSLEAATERKWMEAMKKENLHLH